MSVSEGGDLQSPPFSINQLIFLKNFVSVF